MKTTPTALLALTVLSILSTAGAQAKITAQSIIVNPTTPDLSVNVRVDRDASGAQNPAYRIGDAITISATTNRDAYVYFFNLDPGGAVDQILPNRLGGDNFVKAGTTRAFPAPGDGFTYNVAGPAGQSKVLALASLSPLNLDQLSTFKTQQDSFATVNASTQAGLAQALSIVVSPLPQNSWVSDTAFYTVAAVNPVTTGSLFVATNVNATVLLNGQRLGGSNMTYGNLRPGAYPVRVQASGYREFAGTITIRQGAMTTLNVDLAPQVRPPVPMPRPVPTPPVTPSGSATPVLDFIGNLLGAIAGTQMQDPARSAYDQKVAELQRQGYSIQQSSTTPGGFTGVLVKGASSVIVTVDRGQNRTVRVNVSETTTYQY
ncbi:DUF4384 domain-containing protein [Deinococcus sp.]|uniref:DUF4384 domain-containing protein n=1 Tax=Deinococcus sp. TaxID=47478 RepID=UPI002869C6BB|nr:DUF4384 domain-containing protein [Deinococcus sp.]